MRSKITYTITSIFLLTISLFMHAQNVLDADWDDVVNGKCDDQNDVWWSSAEAIRIAENVLLYQRDIGGWPKNIEMQLELSQGEKDALNEAKSDISGGYCTIDNNAVQLELKYLSKVYQAIEDEEFKTLTKTSFLLGIQYLLDAQFDNGGWPQFYPFRSSSSYSNHITFNDNAMIHAMEILRHIYQKDSEYSILAEEDMTVAAQNAFDNGLDCILRTQYVQNGVLTVWCAQHHYETLAPVDARSYELASLSGGESAGVIKLLMSINNPSSEIIAAIKSAITWYDENRIVGKRLEYFTNDDGLQDRRIIDDPSAPDMWARFYTLIGNTPFFCDRDGIKKYTLAEIGHERRNNYSWYVSSGHSVFDIYDDWYSLWGETSTSLSGIPEENNSIICYPNPSNSGFSINLNGIKNAHIEIYEIAGRRVYVGTQIDNIHIINDQELIPGIYCVIVTDGKKRIQTQKIIVE